jgi:Tfp pilus assembly protein PilX
MTYRYRQHEQGATSLLIVMFSVLLFVVVSVGFMQLMTAEQRSSTDNELSRGAYDSALAGVEDGKRVLKACLDNPDFSGGNAACTAIEADACNTTVAASVVSETDGEVYLQSNSSSASGKEYQQAYTCVKIALNTPDYLGKLDVGDSSSKVVSLKTVERAGRINVQWFASFGGTLSAFNPSSTPLWPRAEWGSLRPSVLKLQLISLPVDTSTDASIEQLDGADGASGAWTTYLYPQAASIASPMSPPTPRFDIDTRNRAGSTGLLNAVWCNADRTTNLSGYVCQTAITLPDGVDTQQDGVYVRITAAYNATDFSVSPQVQQSPSVWVNTKYKMVQPAIDSTGRASDVFRRVEARVETTDDSASYPRATIDITDNLCKTLTVTDTYYSGGSCHP